MWAHAPGYEYAAPSRLVRTIATNRGKFRRHASPPTLNPAPPLYPVPGTLRPLEQLSGGAFEIFEIEADDRQLGSVVGRVEAVGATDAITPGAR